VLFFMQLPLTIGHSAECQTNLDSFDHKCLHILSNGTTAFSHYKCTLSDFLFDENILHAAAFRFNCTVCVLCSNGTNVCGVIMIE